MKTLWNALSFLAIVHLFALVMFVMWLGASDRLSGERIEAARALFAPTLAEAREAAEQAARDAEEEHRAAMEEHRRLNPQLSTESRVRHIARLEEMEQRALRRMADERAVLATALEEAMARLEAREAELESQQRQWEETVAAERARRESEQFAKAVRQYESVPSRQGKNMLLELIDRDLFDQAVLYLDAMNARAASKILAEFRTEEEVGLATELLERLRTLGVPRQDPTPTQELSHAGGSSAQAR